MNEEGKVHGPVSNTDGHDGVIDDPVHDPVSYTNSHDVIIWILHTIVDGVVDAFEDSHVEDGSVDAVDHVGGEIVHRPPPRHMTTRSMAKQAQSVTPTGVSPGHPTHPGPTNPGTPPATLTSSLATPLVTQTATPMLESGTGSSSSSENVLAGPVVTRSTMVCKIPIITLSVEKKNRPKMS